MFIEASIRCNLFIQFATKLLLKMMFQSRKTVVNLG